MKTFKSCLKRHVAFLEKTPVVELVGSSDLPCLHPKPKDALWICDGIGRSSEIDVLAVAIATIKINFRKFFISYL